MKVYMDKALQDPSLVLVKPIDDMNDLLVTSVRLKCYEKTAWKIFPFIESIPGKLNSFDDDDDRTL